MAITLTRYGISFLSNSSGRCFVKDSDSGSPRAEEMKLFRTFSEALDFAKAHWNDPDLKARPVEVTLKVGDPL